MALVAGLGTSLLAIAPVQAVTRGQHITDAKYSVSFYLPASWKRPVVTTTTSSTTKLLIQDVVRSSAVGVVQVQVLNGRHTNASEIADGLLAATSGAKVVGSKVAAFPFGKAEQLDYTIQTTTALVYGTAEAFYLHHVTYIVAFDATSPGINRVSKAAVMESWGT
jgi:hypothetical protein